MNWFTTRPWPRAGLETPRWGFQAGSFSRPRRASETCGSLDFALRAPLGMTACSSRSTRAFAGARVIPSERSESRDLQRPCAWTGSGSYRYDGGALRTVSGKCDADYVIRRHINRYSCKAESVFCRVPFRFARRMPRLAPTNERSSSACLLNEPDIAYSLLPSLRSVIVQRSHRHFSGGLSCLLFSHRC